MPCKFWGWDPDGPYCVNEKIIKLRKKEKDPKDPPMEEYPYGIAIWRANIYCNEDNRFEFFEPHPKGPNRDR